MKQTKSEETARGDQQSSSPGQEWHMILPGWMCGTAKLSLMTPGGGNLTSSQGSVIIFKMFYWGKIYMSWNTLTLGVQFNELWQMYTTVKPTPWSKNKTYARPPNSACIFFPTIWQPRQPVLWLPTPWSDFAWCWAPHKQQDVGRVLLCLASLAQHHVFGVHLWCGVCQ